MKANALACSRRSRSRRLLDFSLIVIILGYLVTTACFSYDGLELFETGTDKVYFSYHGKPLLSFGTFRTLYFTPLKTLLITSCGQIGLQSMA